MTESFMKMLAEGGKSNSLGRTNEVIDCVLNDRTLLEDLYKCTSSDDAWLRMRAMDALEKVCRVHPEWLEPYIDRFSRDLLASTQPSVQWHLAQIFSQVGLTADQNQIAITWLKNLLAPAEVDWIATANAMDALVSFYKQGSVSESETVSLIKRQLHHRSKSVVRRATKHLENFES